MYKISVIIPIYNSSKYLRTCLNSLVNQTLDNIEIIAIDDNSCDNSWKILLEYEEKYRNIKIYHNERNLGQGRCRNIGIKIANGRYIGFVDSDDYINPNMYKTMYEGGLKEGNPDIVNTGLLFVLDDAYANKNLSFMNRRNNGLVIEPKKNPESILDISPSVCNKIFKKDFIEQYKFLENCCWEDIAFSIVTFMKAKKILIFNNPDYFYRRDISRGVSSINYKESNHILDIFKINDEIINSAKKYKKDTIFKNQIKTLVFANCFQRVHEMNYWNVSKSKLENLKFQFFDLIFKKYGNLDNIDAEILSVKVDFNVIDEYKEFINKYYKSVQKR